MPGYARPPEHSRWRKGQSGNPSGRRRKPANFADDLLSELAELVQVSEGGRTRRISKQRALIKAVIAGGIRGNPRAASLLTIWLARVIEGGPEDHALAEIDAKERRIIEDYLERQVQLRLVKQREDD